MPLPVMPSAYGLEAMERSNFVERFSAIGLETELSRTPKIDRARRNVLKAASLVGAFLATSALHSQASAAPGNNGNGNGGCGVGQQTNGCGGNGNSGNSGGNCFARGTLVRTREGYRPSKPWQ
jgi:hypothetical protein